MDDRSEPLARFDRLKATWLVLKVLAVAAAVFVLLRLAAPNLMNTHNDVLCWPAAGLLVLWAGAWIARDIAALRRRATILPPLKRRPGAKGNTP
jgi:hypothetical protein